MGDLDFRFYLSILWRRSPWAITIAVLMTAAAVTVALMMPEVYRANAKILAEAPQIPVKLARSTVTADVGGQLQMLQQQSMTTENVVALAHKLDIYGKDTALLTTEDIVDDMRSRMIFEAIPLDPQQGGQGNMVLNVYFDAGTPELAAKVVNELVSFILGRNARQRTERAEDTLQFFESEVDRLRTELTKTEADILKFKNENKDTLPDSLEFRRNQQVSQQERLLMLEREEAELRSRRNNLVQTYETTGLLNNSGPVSPEQQMLQELNRALSDQLAIFSENSPNIQALRKRIAAVQESLRNRQDEDPKADGKKPLSELDIQLADIDDRLHYIAGVKPALTQSIAELSKTITTTPRNATILNALERNRDNIQTQYNTAVANLAEASTGQQIEMRSQGVRLSILEPATPPEGRLKPNRRRIVGAGVFGAAGLGLAFVVLLEMLNKTIRRPIELTKALELQPLATIPYIKAPAEPRRRSPLSRLAGIFGLRSAVRSP